jgi:protein-tyrosine-phosphatase
MASALAQSLAGDKLEVINGGSEPGDEVNPDMVKVMHEKGIDMAFRSPQSIADAISHVKPDYIITMGCREQCPYVPDARILDWDLADPAGKPIEFMREVRDDIESRVNELINDILP